MCAGLWEVLVGWLGGGKVGCGWGSCGKVGGRRRRECGRVERLFLGSSDVERAHNLMSEVALGSVEAEELKRMCDTDWE